MFIGYCDGGSFSGTTPEPITYKDMQLYFRGRALMTAVIADLMARGMASATDVILTGGSAGGLTALARKKKGGKKHRNIKQKKKTKRGKHWVDRSDQKKKGRSNAQ